MLRDWQSVPFTKTLKHAALLLRGPSRMCLMPKDEQQKLYPSWQVTVSSIMKRVDFPSLMDVSLVMELAFCSIVKDTAKDVLLCECTIPPLIEYCNTADMPTETLGPSLNDRTPRARREVMKESAKSFFGQVFGGRNEGDTLEDVARARETNERKERQHSKTYLHGCHRLPNY